MKILYDVHFTQTPEALETTSPAFHLFATARHEVKAVTLMGMLDAGWPFDVNEVSPPAFGQRSLLLQYLGTFESRMQSPAIGQRPLEQADLDEQAAQLQAIGTGRTFLQESLLRQARSEQVAQRLLDAGADPWVRDHEGRDVLDQAVALGWLPLVDRLLGDPRAPSPAALAQRVLWVPHLDNPRATPGNRIGQGVGLPWLHAAVAYGHHPLFERLLAQGMDVNQRDVFGRTPLFYAPFDATARRVIGHGADLLAMDDRHQTAGQAWPHMVNGAAEKAAMQLTIKAALEQRMADDPERLKAQQASTLFTMAVNDPKAVVVKFMRDNGLNVNLRRPADAAEDAGLSLLAHVARASIADPKRSRAVLQHVAERVEDPWFESVPGIPDAWLSLLAATDNVAVGAANFPGHAWRTMDAEYGLNDDAGCARFLDDGLRLLRGWAQPGTPQAWAVPRRGQEGVQLWAVLLYDLIERTPEEHRLGSPVQAALAGRDVLGRTRTWAWMDVLAQVLHDERLDAPFRLDRLVGRLAGASIPRDGRDDAHRPLGPMMALLPTTPQAVHALLPLLVVAPRDRTTLAGIVKGEPLKDWADSNTGTWSGSVPETHRALRSAFDAGVAVDTAAPGFDARLARLQKVQPFLAQKIEQQILRVAAAPDPQDLTGDRTLDAGVAVRRRL